MTWRQRQAQTYPDDQGVQVRQVTMPVEAPQRPRKPRKPRPVPDCPHCTKQPCGRHSYSPLASLGVAPAQPGSPDERVKDWRVVR